MSACFGSDALACLFTPWQVWSWVCALYSRVWSSLLRF